MTKRFLYLIITSLIFLGFNCSSDNVTAAKRYIISKDLIKAEEYLIKEVNSNPYADEGYFLLGYIKAEQKKYEETKTMFSKSLSISNRFKNKIEEAEKYYNLK